MWHDAIARARTDAGISNADIIHKCNLVPTVAHQTSCQLMAQEICDGKTRLQSVGRSTKVEASRNVSAVAITALLTSSSTPMEMVAAFMAVSVCSSVPLLFRLRVDPVHDAGLLKWPNKLAHFRVAAVMNTSRCLGTMVSPVLKHSGFKVGCLLDICCECPECLMASI